MPITPDFDLLASTYLDCQEAGPRLRELARMVAAYRHNNPEPGQRRARKDDLTAVASNAARLRAALGKIDIGTQVDALMLGVAREAAAAESSGHDAVGSALAPNRVDQLSYLRTLEQLLHTLEMGFAAAADGEAVAGAGGRPVRHDALLMGLEGLEGLWRRHRSDAPNLSEKERGFGALAIDVLACADVGFAPETVRGAVVDFLSKRNSSD